MTKTNYICSVAEELLDINTGDWKRHRLVIDQSACKRCGSCLLYCPVNAVIKRGNDYIITHDYCKGCGVCQHECPAHCIGIEGADQK